MLQISETEMKGIYIITIRGHQRKYIECKIEYNIYN